LSQRGHASGCVVEVVDKNAFGEFKNDLVGRCAGFGQYGHDTFVEIGLPQLSGAHIDRDRMGDA